MSNTKNIAKYAIMPGFIPRLYTLFGSGFSTFAYYIALIFSMVHLLPPNHPYLLQQNFGKYGVRHVISQASRNLVFKRENTDQIIIFFTILIGITLILVQLILFAIALFASQDAFAQFSLAGMFANPSPQINSPGPTQDIAFIILDRVFGLVGVFDSCVSTGVACTNNAGVDLPETIASYPYPFHDALHSMLQFYSLGILAIGALIILYFVTVVIGETAATGTPFGQRFERAWVPIRLVLFFAMLIPLNLSGTNDGLNGAQRITFWVAKQGSNFATNGWVFFNTNLVNGTYLGPERNIIATPNRPEMGALNQFILTSKVCAIAERAKLNNDIKPYIVRPELSSYQLAATPTPAKGTVSQNAREFLTTSYADALSFSSNANINIRFGALGKDINNDGVIDEYTNRAGFINPYCGDMTVFTHDVFEPGSIYIASEYYAFIQNLWEDPVINDVAECIYQTKAQSQNNNPACPDKLNNDFAQAVRLYYQTYADNVLEAGIEKQKNDGDFLIPPELIEKGWAGGAIWFNRIAQMNGAIVDAAAGIPQYNKYPLVMEFVKRERMLNNAGIFDSSPYEPLLIDGTPIKLPQAREEFYPALFAAFNFWEEQNSKSSETQKTDNAFIDTINLILGTSGIFDMRKNTDIHPLAQLTNVGKGMINATVYHAGIAGAGVVGGGLSNILGAGFGKEISDLASNFSFTVITSTIGIGVILYYVLPFLPFIYFIFAVSGWIKSIFEATVAMPLWALAHLRIDGPGIPGQDASNGYFLLFEIFLRPILILFGLIASISIFAALISVLNNVFELLVNVGGADIELEGKIESGSISLPSNLSEIRGPIDEFFFTAMYAIICYLVGISCFKLIDLIPNQILRWAGSSAATFQENAGDPAGQITQNIYKGSVLVGNQVRGATQGDLAVIAGG